jgi:hypothetical protein
MEIPYREDVEKAVTGMFETVVLSFGSGIYKDMEFYRK